MLGYVLTMLMVVTVMEIRAEVIVSANQQPKKDITFTPPSPSKSDFLRPPSAVDDRQAPIDDVLPEAHPFKEHYNTDFNTGIKKMRHVPDYFRHEYGPKSKAQLGGAIYRCVDSDHVALTFDDGIWYERV